MYCRLWFDELIHMWDACQNFPSFEAVSFSFHVADCKSRLLKCGKDPISGFNIIVCSEIVSVYCYCFIAAFGEPVFKISK